MLRFLGFFEIIILKTEREFFTGVIVDRVDFVEDFTNAGFDIFVPTLELVADEVGDFECLVAFGKENTTGVFC